MQSFSESDIPDLCKQLAEREPAFAAIIKQYGIPPFWSRPNTFESLVHIILEQQVSLANAKAALEKLRLLVGEITPDTVLRLTDEELRAVYFSRQKARYTRELARAIIEKRLNLDSLEQMPDDAVRKTLSKLPGIGNWTVDIYLIMVLHRRDVFPSGDLAAIKACKEIMHLASTYNKVLVSETAKKWHPDRTIATMLLWHYYLRIQRSSTLTGKP